MTTDQFAARARSSEAGYFRRRDAGLVEKLRRVLQTKLDKEAIREASGITNEEVLDRLVSLSITGELLAAFKLYPLVEIAWADGYLDRREGEAVLAIARRLGMPRDAESTKRLQDWLERGPNADARAAWQMFARELREALDPDELRMFRREILGYARAVANTSGGLLGVILQMTQAKQRIIERTETALTRD